MAELKTKVNNASVADFLNAIPDAQVRQDCWTIANLMQSAAKAEPKMWGANIVGFGERLQVYADGREAGWPVVAFSPRKQNITLYGVQQSEEHVSQLGKHSSGKGCLYIKRLSDVELPVLKKMVQASVRAKTAKKAK